MYIVENRQLSDCPNGGLFYTCGHGFIGCCLQDPCSSTGCPKDKDRTPNSAATSAVPTTATATSGASPSTSQSETVASVSSSRTSSTAATHESPTTHEVSVPKASDSNNDDAHHKHVGAIAGGIVGGVALLATLLLLCFFCRRKKRIRERGQSTLPSSSNIIGDMSEQLTGTTTIVDYQKNGDRDAAAGSTEGGRNSDLDPLPQLDNTMVLPRSEIGGDPLGAIPELPATEAHSDPFATPKLSTVSSALQPRDSKGVRKGHVDDHVMSWAHFNSTSNRDPAARLSRPHGAPDTSVPVWGNMSPSKEARNCTE